MLQTFEYGVCRTESTDNMATIDKTSSLTTKQHPHIILLLLTGAWNQNKI